MGVVAEVGFSRWPKQGKWLHKRTVVCFDYDTRNSIGGTVVREDSEKPGVMIIQLDDGRFVLSTECQYTLPQ